MSRELLILRHGKSDWGADTDDFHRPLKDRGKRSAQRMAIWLGQKQLLPDLVVSSPAVRALETARKCCKAMGIGGEGIVTNPKIYHGSLEDLTEVITALPRESQRVMLVGHNPGLEELLTYLVASDIPRAKNGKLLPTAAMAHLRLPDDLGSLSRGCAHLEDLIRPADLEKKFPFPSPDGEELRDRPAYYYSQSSVIPFRLTDQGMELLVISSSQKKHFVVPKGIHDPGLSAEDSAAKEAWEEAGVSGEILQPDLGRYRYEKWGAECTVTVFPMKVQHVVPEADWEESHRGREWVSPEAAKARLKQKALVPMIQELQQRYA